MKRLSHIFLMAVLSLATLSGHAEELSVNYVDSLPGISADNTVAVITDNNELLFDGEDPINNDADSIVKKQVTRDWATWRPEPKRALWLALVVPGAGQIYNRKYWKLPIFYGGFVGCAYALNWNGQMYHDYSQAYMDIMDDDPNTQSYNQFLHLGNKIDESNMERYKQIFKSRKDKFRRWRDLSVFVMIGVYALSVIDAYVDASLSDFDISKDLSLHVQPAIINGNIINSRSSVYSSGLGFQCSLNF